jgi:hypothetical protein
MQSKCGTGADIRGVGGGVFRVGMKLLYLGLEELTSRKTAGFRGAEAC